jgi:hypothetical protein
MRRNTFWGMGLLGVVAFLARRMSAGFDPLMLHQCTLLQIIQDLFFMINADSSGVWGGKKRQLHEAKCSWCGVGMLRPNHRMREKMYCSRECARLSSRRRVVIECASCGKVIERPKSRVLLRGEGRLYCSRNCKEYEQKIGGKLHLAHYGVGTSKYRQRAISHYGAKCTDCGFSEHEGMIDVHHRDGNRDNNDLENLQVLCVWCHAMKTRGVECSRPFRSGVA